MGRYIKKETTGFSEHGFIILPQLYSFEIHDTKTSRFGKGTGYTKQEAASNAWNDLKYGDPKSLNAPKSSSDRDFFKSGGESSVGNFSIPGSDIFSKLLMLLFFFILLFKACDYLGLQTDNLISKFFPYYETREERYFKYITLLSQWNEFTQGSEKWLILDQSTFSIPQGIIIFSKVNENRRIYSMNLIDDRSRLIRQISIGEKIDNYAVSPDMKQIAFIISSNKNSNLYLMNSDGSDLNKLITEDLDFVDIAWYNTTEIFTTIRRHPYINTIEKIHLNSGSVIMFAPSVNEYNRKWVSEANREGSRKFYKSEKPSLSSDGTKFAYVETVTNYQHSHITDYISSGQRKINIINLQKGFEVFGKPIEQTHREFGKRSLHLGPQAWSPDGTKLVFSAEMRGAKYRIGILELMEWNFGGKQIRSYTTLKWLNVFGHNPAWSPDGNWIAFDNNGKIYIFDVTNAETKKFPTGEGYFTGGDVKTIMGNIKRVGEGEKALWIQ